MNDSDEYEAGTPAKKKFMIILLFTKKQPAKPKPKVGAH
jgi:hypothetical protein